MVRLLDTLLVELKARIEDVDEVRDRLLRLGAQYVGKFHQTDTYFKVPEGRLKIRENEGQDHVDIVFYDRPDIPEIKKRRVLLVRAQPPATAEKLLAPLFKIKVVVSKIREIYMLEGTRVYLDVLTELGTFIEFELSTKDEMGEIKRSRSILANLCKKLGIKEEQLEALSYSGLLIKRDEKN